MNKNEFTIEKTTVECYKIRHSSGMYWADITIDAKDHTGRIVISSDYGNYARYWGACGCHFKEFLQKLDIHYAADKFGADNWFDLKGTLNSYKQSVLESRRSDSISSNLARVLFNEIAKLKDSSNESEFMVLMSNQCHLMKYFDHVPDIERDVTPQFKAFWKEVWPIFIRNLKEEIISK